MVVIVACLVELEDCDINQMDCMDNTSHLCTAGKGHQGLVKILIEQDDVNPDKLEKRNRTPLFCVAWNGHEGAVKIILERSEVNPTSEEITTAKHCTHVLLRMEKREWWGYNSGGTASIST